MMTCIHEAQTDLIVSLILREFELVQSRLPCLVTGDGVMEQHEVISTYQHTIGLGLRRFFPFYMT